MRQFILINDPNYLYIDPTKAQYDQIFWFSFYEPRITKSFPKSFNVAHDPTKNQYGQSLWFSMSLGLHTKISENFGNHSQSFPKSFNVAHVTKQLRSEIVPCFKTSAKHVEIRNELNATADRKFNEPHCVNVSCSWFWFQHGKHILFLFLKKSN